MQVGNSHNWTYKNGKWFETKEAPDKWSFKFNALKTRMTSAPTNTGAAVNTKFHWYILADQIATKINNNAYMTSMKGVKFKIGHKRPNWQTFSYNYPEQLTYKEHLINILEDMIKRIKDGNYDMIDLSKFDNQNKPIIL